MVGEIHTVGFFCALTAYLTEWEIKDWDVVHNHYTTRGGFNYCIFLRVRIVIFMTFCKKLYDKQYETRP